ncbi:hypothetical protein Pmani_018820 [Petrolisthes manimaculis]|uniref:Uncharacterized protein n=1 Tax=Petrolisthes manimaculis TaxID=1843537 RepID=A0AAE1U4J9_9EUCA|nr:hypothetical protein Pmani_018820 [Petrolisthes manimaculis]
MEGPEIRLKSCGSHWVRVEWGEEGEDDGGGGERGGQTQDFTTSPTHTSSPRDGEDKGSSDSYEDYLALAYAKEVDPDAYLQDEDGGEEGVEEEEVDRTEVYPEEPTTVYTLQLLRPRAGWCTIYRGSGGGYLVEGLIPSQEVKVRVRVTQDDLTSPWTTTTTHTKSGAVSGQDLVDAVREDNATLVRDVLSDLLRYSQVERVDGVVEGGHTALVAGVAVGARDALAVLVERRVAVGAPTAGPHLTPLALAAWLGRTDLVRRLRAAGADWNHTDRNGLTGLHYAVLGWQVEMVKVALQEGGDPILCAGPLPTLTLALLTATARLASHRWKREEVEGEASRMVELLVEGGAQVDQRGSGGNTALHAALTLHLPVIARLLVSLGGDPLLANGRGYTPTHLARLTTHSLDKPTPREEDRPPLGKLEALTHLMDS